MCMKMVQASYISSKEVGINWRVKEEKARFVLGDNYLNLFESCKRKAQPRWAKRNDEIIT